MNLNLQIILAVFSSVVGPLLLLAVIYFLNIPKLIEKHTSTLESLSKAVEKLVLAVDHLQKRGGVIDRILSDMAQQAIDTEMIAKDGLKYPNLRNKRDN